MTTMCALCATVLLTIGQTDEAIIAKEKMKSMDVFVGEWETQLDPSTKGVWKLERAMDGLYMCETFTVVPAEGPKVEVVRSMIAWDKEKKQIRATNHWDSGGVTNQVWCRLDKDHWALNWADGNVQAWLTFKDADTLELLGGDGITRTSKRVQPTVK